MAMKCHTCEGNLRLIDHVVHRLANPVASPLLLFVVIDTITLFSSLWVIQSSNPLRLYLECLLLSALRNSTYHGEAKLSQLSRKVLKEIDACLGSWTRPPGPL